MRLAAQDLIERTQLQLAPAIRPAALIADQIYHKAQLPTLAPFTAFNDLKSGQDHFYGVSMHLDHKAVMALHKKKDVKMLIPVDGDHHVTLLLYPVEIQAPHYRLVDEVDHEYSSAKLSFYRGVVGDDPSAVASLMVFDDQLRIMISDAEGNYNIGKKEGEETYIFYNDMDLGTIPFTCESESVPAHPSGRKGMVIKEENLEKAGECVNVYVEIDNSSYINFNRSVSASESFILGAFAEVATLYDNIGIPIQVSSVRVWTTDDPYNAESNVSSALSYLANNVSSFPGDLFHLVSARNSNSFSGIGYLSCRGSGPCKATTIGTGIPFAVSQTSTSYRSYPTYSWTVAVLAHEMGHTMGAPHTH